PKPRISKVKPKTPISTVPPQNIQALTPVTLLNLQDEINQLEESVRFDVIPNSQKQINQKEAIALQEELQNLIGRVKSANLAASVHNSQNTINKNLDQNKANSNLQQTLTQSKDFLKNIPLFIQQKNHSWIRQQWLITKQNLSQQFPINQQLASSEIRSVWLDRGTIVKAGSEAELAKIFDRLKQAGINTVFFETINASYPIYPSQIAPQQNPLIRGWDPLASAVKLAHARGMELHAWVWVFAAGNQGHNKLLNLNPDYPGPVLAARPDWANYDQRGKMIPIGQTKPFLDPANPEVREYLLKLYEEIVSRYQVDGLQLDYIRYPFQDPFLGRSYGYGKAAREQFQQKTGVDPVNISPNQRDLWLQWTAFRTQQVDNFVSQVSQMLQQKRCPQTNCTKPRSLILSVAVFPLPEQERIQKLQQHWEVWARRGDVDLIVPMTYAVDTPRFQRLAQPWINSTKLGSTLLVPGIRLLSLSNIGAFDQLQLVRDLPVSGYALFAAENFNREIDQMLSSTQGQLQNSKTEPIPQRQPFRAAAFRYIALQKEWQFVGKEGQLRIAGTTIANFNQQVKEVQAALNELTVLPSAGNLIKARETLYRFNAQFPSWMQLEARVNPYQVKVWENRLIAIERLLRYGERRVNLLFEK
ncbi:family 10 glycosylhydrolase, partial [Cronbergia sp. UHCC 0137]|uniref:glycoside hydrolase family 10 protein n=1 Tax=Cronbergia sp. UHCC 0137 TaxID=3110239 RepID=UPI002B20BF35